MRVSGKGFRVLKTGGDARNFIERPNRVDGSVPAACDARGSIEGIAKWVLLHRRAALGMSESTVLSYFLIERAERVLLSRWEFGCLLMR
jgi:hypothetical protein